MHLNHFSEYHPNGFEIICLKLELLHSHVRVRRLNLIMNIRMHFTERIPQLNYFLTILMTHYIVVCFN